MKASASKDYLSLDYDVLAGVSDNAQGFAVRSLFGQSIKPCIFITHHDRQLEQFMASAAFFLPKDVPIIAFPAWDTLPYDRSAPSRSIIAQRVAALSEILRLNEAAKPYIVVTTASAFMQKLPPKATFDHACRTLKVGERAAHDEVVRYLSHHGYRRASRVMEAGEFAVRGDIMDIFPSNATQPYRLDFFGSDIEAIKMFDPLTQRSGEAVPHIYLAPTSEILLNDTTVSRFKQQYKEIFGQPSREDMLYHTIAEHHDYIGMEHWLPLFYPQLDMLSDYVTSPHIILDHGTLATFEERAEIIEDYYNARTTMQDTMRTKGAAAYNPVPPDTFFLSRIWKEVLSSNKTTLLQAFDEHEQSAGLRLKPVKKPYIIAKSQKQNPIEYLAQDIKTDNRMIVLAGMTHGSVSRLQQLLKEERIIAEPITHWDEVVDKRKTYITQLPIPSGFQSEAVAFYSEEDVLGRRIIQKRVRKSSSEAFMQEAASFEEGELLVHKDHGIARFGGLQTLEVSGKKHDFIILFYRGDDKLFLPVENMDVLSRHGGDPDSQELDKLGAGNWQSRKAAFKEKLRMTAEELLKVAAARELAGVTRLHADNVYQEFASQFAYEETDDQARAIEEVIADLQGNKPMDRLICGDVGFGKTEVAIRAAFIAATDAFNPVQVAVIAPTTLLVRQHYKNFVERFEHTGLKIGHLSRLCTPKQLKQTKEAIENGTIDVVIGTHALLADSLKFKNLGLLIIDEEQRFGVKQKEKLKKLKADIHILTMSATPIPRTLQMALSGVRELSLITTPPVDRLAIRSFVMPFDPMIIQEAIKREMHRGGQVFYVTPRIADLPELKHRILELVPEARLAVAHGQMGGQELDALMNDVYDGKYDILLSTTIIESGIDIPTANTMIINRADRFGLAQLYQLRGRVGRGKVRAYAYFTLPYHGAMSADAVKRLEVMQTLDTLGAGFTLASHDMDIRGFGNLVGEEQSGHVKDVGIELYQHMLAEAVKQAREQSAHVAPLPSANDDWSPQLNLGMSVLIPEYYVEDVSLRLSLYRRVSNMDTAEEIESFAAELADRFGTIPEEAESLFTVLKLKQRCRKAGIAKIDTGPKGAVIHFHDTAITNPDALIGFIHKHSSTMKLRADQSLFYAADWKDEAIKLRDISNLVDRIGAL
jgi:transcription-repair coupling factor (superfamily II helicase)